jgi:hypothetical protein
MGPIRESVFAAPVPYRAEPLTWALGEFILGVPPSKVWKACFFPADEGGSGE